MIKVTFLNSWRASFVAGLFVLCVVPSVSADLSAGTQSEGRLQSEFTGVITEVRTKGKKRGFIAEVDFEGNLESGMPFTATGMVQIGTDALVAPGEAVRGRFRANAVGEILSRDPQGVSFSADGDIFRGEWMTPSEYGSTDLTPKN